MRYYYMGDPDFDFGWLEHDDYDDFSDYTIDFGEEEMY
jgi:hypothetical protein